ncbi:MAG TPA: tRNA (adenosine(37)-N6)-threonylcarbamoyltransferase complex transferase subunit TsaD, partial [Candidatus Saccharibacteria bacterium]|nr:tRNA (adenosine(37)-N6)-threonylcarbamoyltransferase complex transferase subunit TsaD [Candidatus Saccharibacteria bacterium]HMR37936.1 tRNA (adenosine(37)-N6)-threonylcarbamoyltransferase complex transferase subunit TsaD [Candidatus Saccharibacteria bacterium]
MYPVKILGIESSCDETAAAVVEDGKRLLSNVVNTQIDIHAEYGGVIPEIAARSHLEVINPVIHKALTDAACTWDDIDAIAVTYAPGLIGSLLIGTLAARTLAIIHDKPLHKIHHVEAHVYANFITEHSERPSPTEGSAFPAERTQ